MLTLRNLLRLLSIAITILMFALLIVYLGQVAANPDEQPGRPDQTTLTVPPQANHAIQRGSDNVSEDAYVSPITQAARPFTHMLLRWAATRPTSSTLHLEVRVSPTGTTWSAWAPVIEDSDLWMPADGETVAWSQVLYAGEARFWQVRARYQPNAGGELPALQQVDVHTVDARFTPAPQSNQQHELEINAARAVAPNSTDGKIQSVARPPVVNRTDWLCPDGEGSRVSPAYATVNHLVIHHTDDSNTLGGSESNWGDRVRAIWSFHTFSRGWGDIGYNYLVDPNGVIYEGRSGGDDAVGFHDTANYGSMGVSMIGTYINVTPTDRAQSSLVELLGWKASQKGIDPLGSSFYLGCSYSNYCNPFNLGAVVLNIAGHREVTPQHTTCPGDALANLLPTIRTRVQDRLNGGGGPPDNGDLVIEEQESTFTRSNANWHTTTCGDNGGALYTYATDTITDSTNSATWRPTIPTTGRYRVFAYITHGCNLSPLTDHANYQILSADGVLTHTLSQNASEGWVDLGGYTFTAGISGAVQLNDLTGESFADGRSILFDSLKWVAESELVAVDLLNMQVDRTTVAAGDLVKVTFTVKNSGGVTVTGQAPQAGTLPTGGFDPQNGYVYDEGECFLGANDQSYPTFPKETGSFRVTLGAVDRTVACAGATSGYPWRWGLNGALAPAETRVITGYVRFTTPGTVTLQAGLIQEYVRYFATNVATTTITITNELQVPSVVAYDSALRPLAQVYQLGAVPANLLARTRNALSITHTNFLGERPWEGSPRDWRTQGITGTTQPLVVAQTRVFTAPISGTYTFRTTADDGAWLWVDGQLVINRSLPGEQGEGQTDTTGTTRLITGTHTLSVLFVDQANGATMGYAVQPPNSNGFAVPLDGIGGNAMRFATTFTYTPTITIGGDDQGGSGLARLRYSWDGRTWKEAPSGQVALGQLANGAYQLRYQAIDNAGNATALRDLRFNVNTQLHIQRVFLPIVLR